MNDERLRRAYSDLVDREAPGDRVDCPPPEDLLALVERRGSDEQRLRTLDHVMGCARCRPELELIRAADVASGREGKLRKPFWRRNAVLAAGIALAFIGGTTWLLTDGPETSVYREGQDGPASLVEPRGSLPERPAQLLWRSVDDAVRYRVEVLAEGGALVYQTTTTDTILPLPPEPELLSGDYVWRVDAVLLGGATRSLGVASFSVEVR